jgi:acyl carrier protein
MSKHTTLEAVVEILHRVGKVPTTTDVRAETRLVEDLGIDSLDLVAVFLAVQDRYDVIIDDEIVPSIRCVADLVAEVEGQVAGVAA